MRLVATALLTVTATALAACAPAGGPARPVGHEAAPPRACLPRALRDGGLAALARQADGSLNLCVESGPEETAHACLLVDRSGRVLGEAAWQPPRLEERAPEHTLVAAGQGYSVCTRSTGRCASFRVPRPLHESLKDAGTLSADGARAFVLHDRQAPRSPYGHEIVGELYDVGTGRLLASARLTTALEMGTHP